MCLCLNTLACLRDQRRPRDFILLGLVLYTLKLTWFSKSNRGFPKTPWWLILCLWATLPYTQLTHSLDGWSGLCNSHRCGSLCSSCPGATPSELGSCPVSVISKLRKQIPSWLFFPHQVENSHSNSRFLNCSQCHQFHMKATWQFWQRQ